jgi:hypothetical protein
LRERFPWPGPNDFFETSHVVDVFEHLHLMPGAWLHGRYHLLITRRDSLPARPASSAPTCHVIARPTSAVVMNLDYSHKAWACIRNMGITNVTSVLGSLN